MLPVKHFSPGKGQLRRGFPIEAILLPALLLAASAAAATPDQPMACGACHETSLQNSVHQDFDCADCHSNIQDVPHGESPLEELGGAELCAQCHDDVAETAAASVHGGIVDCVACHGDAHAVRSPSDLSSTTAPLQQIQTCARCHDSPQLMDGYLRSVHGRALVVAGLINAPSCSDCHGSHSIFGPSDRRSKVAGAEVPNTCGACHTYLLNTWRDESAHGQVWLEGKEGPVCSTCHSSHTVMEPRFADQRLKFPESCANCHGDRYATYRDSFHGQITHLGFLTAATCSDCHTPHQNLPASDARSSIHPDNLRATCSQCHARVNDSFLTFDPHLDPSSAERRPQVYYVWLFMTALLIAVFGFFGIHDLLWLQRSLVGCWRGEFAVVRERGGPHVKRFKKLDIRLHMIIIASFLLLAATGLPIKFHFTGWARDLAFLFGGIDMARSLHRLAAIVTFGYAFVHAGHIVKRTLIKKEYGLLWGWRSMVPRPEDFADLGRNVRYFLYLGPRPVMGRWTYWEKFDYFAVFWGVVIIGLSGLVLWFPGFFTLFLPGWALNAAFVIHSDEALLATGFIFVFHFFHTHLRPEVFPMDPVIFTGSMPLEQFKEERPREYRRLVESGELEDRLVDPPSPRSLRNARIFGFAALAVGVVLLIGILMGFLLH